MYTTIHRLYAKTQDESLVRNAVLKNWITAEQYSKIVGKNY